MATTLHHRRPFSSQSVVRVGGRAIPSSSARDRPTANRRPEAVLEVLRNEVVDYRVGARVAVGEAVAEDADHLVPMAGWHRAEYGQQLIDVQRQPQYSEDQHHQEDDLRDPGRPTTSLTDGRRAGLVQMVDDDQIEHTDDDQWYPVPEEEERQIEGLRRVSGQPAVREMLVEYLQLVYQ